MKKMYLYMVLLLTISCTCWAQGPFAVDALISADSSLRVSFSVPDKHYLYADQIIVQVNGRPVDASKLPAAKKKIDQFTEKEVGMYVVDAVLEYPLPDSQDYRVKVSYQGCNDTVCFLPAEKEFMLGGATRSADSTVKNAVGGQSAGLIEGFKVAGSASGYVKEDAFLEFVDSSLTGVGGSSDGLGGKGLAVTLLVILLGGLALNLTPCVLPMIPINIAIIGAGVGGGSKSRGFLLGAVYGLGIALVYGILGLLVVLTGSRFGTLNSSPWFNVGIAVVFTALSLSMFGAFNLDFSRFQGKMKAGGQGSSGSFVVSFFLGGVAALLAGACVAPVVISVLLLAADMHQRNNNIGLLLPFILGLGMALPWPFAGAGISFLPKPGKWMEKIKYGFGVVILVGAGYYGLLAATLFQDRMETRRFAVVEAQEKSIKEGWHTNLESALAVAKLNGKPVFIDFWASWCKNCLKMEKTTFKSDAVKARLNDFVKVKYRAEDLRNPETRAVLDAFDIVGLPTYVVLLPKIDP